MATNVVQAGRYRHWKGRYYEVLGVGVHTETEEEFVVYMDWDRNPDSAYYLRPLRDFLEAAEVDGRRVPRFVPAPREG